MNFEEHAAKPLLRAEGIHTPEGFLVGTPNEAREAAQKLGPCVVKAQVTAGKRGKAGGIRLAADPQQAFEHAQSILGMHIGGFKVERLLVEQQVAIEKEFYAAVLNDAASKSPRILFSAVGGMDIEELAVEHPATLRAHCVDIRTGFCIDDAQKLVAVPGLEHQWESLAEVLFQFYQVYANNDAELVEINPLCLTGDGRIMALDCKFTLDDSAIQRRQALAEQGTPEPLSEHEARGQELSLKFIQLDGDVGVLANGAGLTMTTMDVITHLGGKPANFLEIGGEAYTRATAALELVLDNPRIKSLVVNFCGAFARTDVMTGGVIKALQELEPGIPVFFSIHGTGAMEARAMLKAQLGMDSFATMDEAINAANEVRQ